MKSILFLSASLLLTACNQQPGASNEATIKFVDVKSPAVTATATPAPTAAPDASPTATPVAQTGNENKIALVYAGPGVCAEDCAAAAAESARLAGLTPRLVQANSLPDNATPEQVDAFYKDVVLWIEPGGHSKDAWQGMSQKLRTSLKEYIRAGGGYVGFCAGAFMSTAKIGTTGVAGLGVFPGNTRVFGGKMLETIDYNGDKKTVYWEGGPYLYNLDSTVEVMGYYRDGSVATARTQYGAGRVYISGPHPEAPAWWSSQGPTTSLAGPNQQIAADMIKWAARVY